MERFSIRVEGIVQGVGFRPFVYRLASELNLRGFVRNQASEVLIEIEGEPNALVNFQDGLLSRPPIRARIRNIRSQKISLVGDRTFRIDSSSSDPRAQVVVCPDIAVCGDCLAEMRNPTDRRYRYPFINCTNCGPRLTITTAAPYDRPQTSMAAFAMCEACRSEYDDPDNRRFHAQPIACPKCGPSVQLLDAAGVQVHEDPFRALADALFAGRIAAVKGLGGYHLVCDATNAVAIAELRRRKHRDEKPFAVMVPAVEFARSVCDVSNREAELLASPQAPIVLLRRLPSARIAELVAPKNPCLGVMLPYTPLHHLVLSAVGGIPLVMTSGNRSDEPITQQDDDAQQRLAGIADCFLVHNRPIAVRCDDSVTRIVQGAELPIRRSRGYAPVPIELPFECSRPILAVGGQLKATFAMARDRQAILSHHLGDLDHLQAFDAFERDVSLYEKLFATRPEFIAHDLHPDYASTRYAVERAATEGIQLVSVQHHHAHMASCMAEHGLQDPVIGVIFDGTGLGTDGTIWGGEFLVGDYQGFRRAAHLRNVGLPGGEQAVREPWRVATAHLLDAHCGTTLFQSRLPAIALRTIETMLERGLNSPATSSAGRLFDAIASIIGVRDRTSYEAQAAMELEWLASEVPPDGVYPFEIESPAAVSHGNTLPEIETGLTPNPFEIDTRPLIQAVVADLGRQVEPAVIARRFHSTVAEVILATCLRIDAMTGIRSVVLSGGVFMNALLLCEAVENLSANGFTVYRHRLVPPNDGGLSLGQLAVAASILQSRRPNHS